MKQCFKCYEIKPLADFYKHPMMSDGHLNKCKECARADVRQNRRKRAIYYRAYDQMRSKNTERIARAQRYLEQQRRMEPEKDRARQRAGKALKRGQIEREPCYFCKSSQNLEMHHPDYKYPLRIYWLCRSCHRKLDNMNKLGFKALKEAS